MIKSAVKMLLCAAFLLCCTAGAWATTYGSHYGVVDRWYGQGGQGSMDIILQNLGAKWIRDAFNWDEIEVQDNVYDWVLMDSMVDATTAIGVNQYIGIGYTPAWARPAGTTNATPPTDPTKYTEFIAVMVNRYKDRVKYWGFWNEPNLSVFYNGTLDSYIHNLLLPAIDAVKAADPTAKTVVGELSTSGDDVGKLRTILREIVAHGKKDKVDVICHHSYDGNDTYQGRLADIDNLRSMIVAEGFGDKDFWITETSWESGQSGESGQATHLIGMMEGMNARPWWKKTFWYTLGEGESGGPGLIRPDQSPKPSYLQYQQYISDHADDSEIVSDTIPATMVAGRQYYVSVSVKNTGTVTWQDENTYKLGAVNDSDPFAGGRQPLGPAETVAPDDTKTFWFTMTAPSTTGTYTTDWRMVHEGVRWFGHPLVKQVIVNNGPDTTPPASTLNFTATPGDYKVTLSWQNPTDADFTGTMIRYKTTGFPASVTDGTLLINKTSNPGTSDSYVHTGLANGTTYYYSAFAHDPVPNYAAKRDAATVPVDNEPPGQIAAFAVSTTSNRNTLSWTNPASADFAGTMVRYRTDTYPTGPTDGTLLCNRTASPGSSDSFVHSGILNGTTYYYTAFAHDEIPNYSTAATASGTPVGPRQTISKSTFSTSADGWTTSVWKAGPYLDGVMAWNNSAGRTGGGMRCNGSGNTDDTQSCVREGGEIWKIIPTTGYQYIQVSFDLRVNNLGNNVTGPGDGACTVDHNLLDEQLTVFYSTDGGINWIESEFIKRAALLSYQTYGTRTIDLTGITACDNNASFMLRFRWQVNTTSDAADLDNIQVSGNILGLDVTPPAPVTNFSVIVGNTLNNLSWTNPLDSDYAGTMIRYKANSYPANTTDGTHVYSGTETSFTHTGLTNGTPCYYSAFAYDGFPNYSVNADATGTPIYFDPLQAKLLAHNTPLTLTAGIVSASFTNQLYVQCPDKPLGIRVDKSSHGLSVGQSVGVKGTALTDPANDEKYISATWVQANSTGAVWPLAMSASAIGGINWNYNQSTGAGQAGIKDGVGPNNISLLVRVYGKVTQKDSAGLQYFYIDDGSDLRDGTSIFGTANTGIRIKADPTAYPKDSLVIVTGIVSCFKEGSNLRPQILPRVGEIRRVWP